MISVIIVNYGSAPLTKRAVESVLGEEEAAEIFVVDNTATDVERSALQTHLKGDVHLILNEKNEGFARACNIAYARSKGEWIFLLNPDSYLLPGALKRLKEFMTARPRTGAAGPKIYWDDRKAFLLPPSLFPSAARELSSQLGRISGVFSAFDSMLHRRRSLEVWTAKTPLRQGALSGGHVMLRRSAVDACGGLFDERFFMYYEDSDLMLRLKKAGYEFFVVPQAEVVHNYVHTAEKMELMEESKGLYFDKHFMGSFAMKMADGLSKRKSANSQKGFMHAGKTKAPLRIEIPSKLRRRWLFEWSPSPVFIPSVGFFGSGPVLEFPQAAWDLLGPGIYYARISTPLRIVFSGVLWSWEKE